MCDAYFNKLRSLPQRLERRETAIHPRFHPINHQWSVGAFDGAMSLGQRRLVTVISWLLVPNPEQRAQKVMLGGHSVL